MTTRPVVAFVTSGGPTSAMAERARSFAERISGDFDPRLVHGRGGRARATLGIARQLAAIRPDVCLVLDVAIAGMVGAGLHKILARTPLIVDTGDAVVDLGRALGRGPIGMAATKFLEAASFASSTGIVVRGTYHKEILASRGIRSVFIPDGVVVDQFAPTLESPPATDRPLTIGLVGHSVWSPVHRSCYGSDLVELVRILRDRLPTRPIRGIMIGDGSGIDYLRQQCDESGLADRIEFAGRVPYPDLPVWLRRLDICLSTQTNDVIGNVRTTGKLPLYLAAGRFVLASRVGEAARILPPEMLVEYRGSFDPDYPSRMADHVEGLLDAGTSFTSRPDCVALARIHFDYDRLAPVLNEVIHEVLQGRWRMSR